MTLFRAMLLVACFFWVSRYCRASARQDELERYMAPQILNLGVSAASLDLIYARDRGTRKNELYGTRSDRELESYDARLNLALDGFVYHPYFFDFNAAGSIGYVTEDGRVETRGESELDEDLGSQSEVTEYNVSASLLKRKPYSMTVFANRSIAHFDSDFFTRLTSDGQGYGISGRYWNRSWPLLWSYVNGMSDTWGSSRSSHNEDSSFSAITHNKRDRGESRLTYLHQEFLRETDDVLVNEGVQRQAMFSDRRMLGASGNGSLNSLARFVGQDGIHSSFRSLSAEEDMYYRLAEAWSVSSSYGYSRYETDGAVSQTHQANAALGHRLFESLASSVSVDAELTDSEGSDATRFGAGFGESYTKKLGASTRLDLAYGHRESWEDRTSAGDSMDTIRESVTLRDGGAVILGATGIDATGITVRDAGETVIYEEGFDYSTIPVGERTQIQRLVGGRIPNGATVVVTYQARSGDTDQFGTSNDSASFRLHLLGNHVEMYGRMNTYRVSGALASAALEGTEKNIGASCSWGLLSGGVDYIDSDMTLSTYTRLSSYESLQFSPFSRAHLGLSFQQSRTDYPETDDSLQTRSETATFDMTISRDMIFRSSAGQYREKALNEENHYVTMSASLSASIGLVQASLGHDYRESLRGEDADISQRSYLKLRRTF